MEIVYTKQFEKDIKNLPTDMLERIDAVARLLMNNERPGKALHYVMDVYSVRIENKRLVYQLPKNEKKVIFLLFKSREEVYKYISGS
ncbi:MAG: type II toxin-antitoxin system RelE/ParE family toxin [Candidatus Micrarchaeota archaeon]|nr:type II toxin-antitoxin system RelE/ParE family toxin [Candidatus Micrarchaeota archaeon]